MTNDDEDGNAEEYYFDDDTMRWKTRPKQIKVKEEAMVEEKAENVKDNCNDEDEEVEVYFDDSEKQWRVRDKKVHDNGGSKRKK
eukprot:1491637-Ditylum_brightwellii.AAC.1